MITKTNLRMWKVVLVLVVGIGCTTAGAAVRYVNDDASGDGTGLNWTDAYNHLQDALADANSNPDVNEIWVAEGTYKPDQNSSYPNGTGDRTATFQLINAVAIYGGFVGYETSLGERMWPLAETILSGDLDSNDMDVGEPCDLINEPTRAENSYHVVTGSGTEPSAILDGFIIRAGNANDVSAPDCYGSGMYNDDGSPTVANCIFTENSAQASGGGMNNYYAHPKISNCTFSRNCAEDGGGMRNYSANATLSNCMFFGNCADDSGGGMDNYESDPCLVNCVFSGNSSYNGAGAMYNHESDPNVISCTFSKNTAKNSYGGIYNDHSSAYIANCILWGNSDSSGHGESAQIFAFVSPLAVVKYSCIEGWSQGGVGNINEPPLFIDANGPDGEAGTDDDNLRLAVMSPCVDAGDSNAVPAGITTDIAGNARFTDNPAKADTGTGTEPIVDMGAYELRHIYVDCNVPGGEVDGTSWANAYFFLQDGLADADDGGAMVFVAECRYKPDVNSNNPEGSGLRTETFQLVEGVGLYGGFPQGGGTWSQRDPNAYPTILSGDLDGNDVDVAEPCDLIDHPNRAGNAYHVVTGADNAVIDGFIITAGNANDPCVPSIYCYGGGMYNKDVSPAVANCVFRENSADVRGGGMHNYYAHPTITNCTFSRNWSDGGGGMYNRSASPTLNNCMFYGNSAWGGGGMYNSEGNPDITNCIFSGNSSYWSTGAMYNIGEEFGGACDPDVINCTFSRNTAKNNYGGIRNYDNSSPYIANCIVWGNSDKDGFDEEAQISGSATVTFSCIEGWSQGGVGNINEPPQFVDANGSDGEAGTADDDLRLLPTSPCIDEGNNVELPADSLDLDGDGNTTEPIPYDLDGRARIFDGDFDGNSVVDMGAYEFYHEGVIIYVDEMAGGAGDGTSWDDAYHFLQDGLRAALYGDEIRVAKGIYKPDSNSNDPGGSRDREATFQLKSGVVLKGGYAGWNEPSPDARDVSYYETTLTGDLNQDDAPVAEPCDLLNEPTRAENAYHVVTANDVNGAVLDGFIITAGNANDPCLGSIQRCGGGIHAVDSNLTVSNCFLRVNSAAGGGAVWSYWSKPFSMTHCTVSRNYAGGNGGGLSSYSGVNRVVNSVFSGNHAGMNAGAVADFIGEVSLINCSFSENQAALNGGGIMLDSESTAVVTNCILWGNRDQSGCGEFSQINAPHPVTYSCIQGWSRGGVGNINEPPQFADANGPDDIAGTEDDNLRLGPNSPCIDEGNDLALPGDVITDLDRRVRISDGDCNSANGMSVDMGAYEFAWVYIGDFDGECDVDFADWALFAMAWLTEEGQGGYISDYDISIPADNKIDWRDVEILCDNWLARIEP